jgi:hypothetical protein
MYDWMRRSAADKEIPMQRQLYSKLVLALTLLCLPALASSQNNTSQPG